MRLLDTGTLELSDFNDQNTRPYYAILSHTWGDDEFIFSDFAKPDRRSSAGWRKIVRFCELAAADGWEYAWVDTCCIDKSSSAELTEAINSMWKWYQSSQICYVHLADCYISYGNRDLHRSRWFTRGWTLQELLAPKGVVFYDAEWQEIGSRSYIRYEISRICRIDPDHLMDPTAASVATKMSWASRRETTREEDLAYSLLGLFDIKMSLIYGEGSKAFFRLQSEIIRSSTDQSIFAWTIDNSLDSYAGEYQETGMLAPSLSCFEESGNIVPKHFEDLPQTPYQMTNHGLQIEFGCVEVSKDSGAFLSRILEPYNERIGKLVCQLTEDLDMSSPRDSGSPHRSKHPELWLVMLPCVSIIQKAQPIALLIHRSLEGRYTRASTRRMISFRKEMSPESSSCRFESMSFLIANENKAGHRLWSVDPKGPAFIEIGPVLQTKVRHVQSSCSKPMRFDPETEHPFARHSQGAQNVFIIEIEEDLRLVMVFDCVDSKCSVFTASEGQCSRLSSLLEDALYTFNAIMQARKPLSSYVGTYIVTLGEIDDHALQYKGETRILIRTRRVFRGGHEYFIANPYRGNTGISCAIRLDLYTISEQDSSPSATTSPSGEQLTSINDLRL